MFACDESTKLRRVFTVGNKLGLHARAAARVVETTSRYRSRILMVRNGREADAKSILSILTLACTMGSQVEVIAEGEDAHEAMQALAALFNGKFGEE